MEKQYAQYARRQYMNMAWKLFEMMHREYDGRYSEETDWEGGGSVARGWSAAKREDYNHVVIEMTTTKFFNQSPNINMRGCIT